jgi:hypothetical protein
MVAGQTIGVGVGHAGLTVTAVGDSFQISDEARLLTEVPHRATTPIARFKARQPELPRRPEESCVGWDMADRSRDSRTSGRHHLAPRRAGFRGTHQLHRLPRASM